MPWKGVKKKFCRPVQAVMTKLLLVWLWMWVCLEPAFFLPHGLLAQELLCNVCVRVTTRTELLKLSLPLLLRIHPTKLVHGSPVSP